MNVEKLDFVAIPTTDPQRTFDFYVNTLGLRPDEHRPEAEFWAGETCVSPWKPEWAGQEFAPSNTCLLALHVDDVAEARSELEQKGIPFLGDLIDSGVCHMAIFKDPDGNVLMLHNRYAPYE
jgi:catechol 2,3-dioxygenase-like lactoylglutathione lyase family enzyme